MTIDKFNIKSVAIIGGGPGGLTTLNELLNTSSDGTTTVHSDTRPVEPAFSKIVLFEQKDRVGGVWATDVHSADVIPDEILKSNEYYKPNVIQPVIEAPSGLKEANDLENPVVSEAASSELQWRKSGVYPHLYSNVPRRFLRFSTIPYDPKKYETVGLDPLITHQEISNTLSNFVKDNNLDENIRTNTQVQSVRKDVSKGKWILTLRHTNKSTNKDEWYTEVFDAIVVSSGHYSVPYIPYVEGLETRDASSVIHAKSFRNADNFANKRVVVVGSSLSGIDIIQYIYTVAKDLYVSRTPGKDEIYPWLTRAANSLETKPRLKKISGRTVEFEDGSVLEDVDHIIFSTGYHWNYQYLPSDVFQLTEPGYGDQATSASRIKGLYYDTFNIEDPTIGYVGIGLTPVKFHTLETSGAALAGVWSNAKALPSKQDQYAWESKRLKDTADNLIFHYYPCDVVKEQWVEKVFNFATVGRKNPLEGEDFSDYDRAFEKAEEIFYDMKEGKGNYSHI